MDYIKGRGAQKNPHNRFESKEYVSEHPEGIDEQPEAGEFRKTRYIDVHPKTILNEVKSPDIGPALSMNPYQGCEHGCIYCYARNSHNYWGYNAGVDFERNVLVKKSAPELLQKAFDKPNWKVRPVMLSGNTDCYQPAEKKFGITRKLLEIFACYRHPVGIITKNSLILRDMDVLCELNSHRLVHVSVSLTTFDESLRRKMEPRTATGQQRLKVIEQLSAEGIPVNVMIAPVIPWLNSHELPGIVERVAGAGARSVNYLTVRLNGDVGALFEDWVEKNYPGKARKILAQIREFHGGQLNDSRFGTRMKGEGVMAGQLNALFHAARKKFFPKNQMPPYNCDAFRPPGGQMKMKL